MLLTKARRINQILCVAALTSSIPFQSCRGQHKPTFASRTCRERLHPSIFTSRAQDHEIYMYIYVLTSIRERRYVLVQLMHSQSKDCFLRRCILISKCPLHSTLTVYKAMQEDPDITQSALRQTASSPHPFRPCSCRYKWWRGRGRGRGGRRRCAGGEGDARRRMSMIQAAGVEQIHSFNTSYFKRH